MNHLCCFSLGLWTIAGQVEGSRCNCSGFLVIQGGKGKMYVEYRLFCHLSFFFFFLLLLKTSPTGVLGSLIDGCLH